MNTSLKIDPEFEALCPPLTDEEYEQLEDNILAEGEVLTPIIVWDGTIIDGHNRYEILQGHPEIKYSIREKQFANRHEAVAWICRNQLGRRNLTEMQKTVLMGRRYDAEKLAYGDRRSEAFSKGHDDRLNAASNVTAQRLATELGVSEATVRRANAVVAGLDAAEEVLPGVTRKVLEGTIKPTKKEVIAVAKAAPEERRQRAEELRIPKEKPKMSRAERHQELAAIRAINDEMRRDGSPTSGKSMLVTLHGVFLDMIRVSDMLLCDYPQLLTDSACREKVIEMVQEVKQYILKLEEDAQRGRTA